MSGGGPMPQSTPQYDAYIAQQNFDNVQAAAQAGGSAVPTVRTGVTETVIEDAAPPKKKAPEEDPESARRRNEEREKQLADAQKRYDEARRANDEAIKARKEAMSQQVGLLVKIGSLPPIKHLMCTRLRRITQPQGQEAQGRAALLLMCRLEL